MSAAIPGHGYREEITPSCKCGWRGRPAYGSGSAMAQYEQHKAEMRHRMGASSPSARRRLPATRRLVPDPNAPARPISPVLRLIPGGQSGGQS